MWLREVFGRVGGQLFLPVSPPPIEGAIFHGRNEGIFGVLNFTQKIHEKHPLLTD